MPHRILIIDDHKDTLSIFSEALARAGYEVVTAKDGQEAFSKILHSRPDLVLLDLILPEVDGFAICDALKFSPSFRSIPVLMMSAWTDSHSILKEKSRRAGAEELLAKPLDPKELIVKVGKYLNLPAA